MSPRVNSTSTCFIAPGSLATRSRIIPQSLGSRASETIQPPSRATSNDGIRPAAVLPSVVASARARSISQPFDSLPPSVEFDEANDLPESLTNNSPPGSPTIGGKSGRGKTRSCGVEKICNGKDKLVVVFDPIFNKPVDDVARKFVSELGYLVRTNAPLFDIKSWNDAKEIDKQPIYTRAQKQSVANQRNRKKLLYNHVSGSKAYATRLRTKNPETGTCPDMFDVYRDKPQRADRTWVAPTAENLYRQMMEMKEKPIEEGEKSMSDEEIREAVLGHKSGYVRGLGPSPKLTSTRGSTSSHGPTQEDFDNMNAQIEALTQMIVQQSYGGMGPSSSSW